MKIDRLILLKYILKRHLFGIYDARRSSFLHTSFHKLSITDAGPILPNLHNFKPSE